MTKLTFAAAVILLVALVGSAVNASAQNNEIAISLGGYFPMSNPVSSGNAFAIEGTVAHRIFGVPMVSAYIEVPIVGTFSSSVPSTGLLSSASYSALFIAPGLKIKIGAAFPISPYLAAGGGLARYSKSSNLAAATATGTTTNTGVFDVGGGLDMKIAPFLSLRGEMRDFYSGSPAITLPALQQKQHNLLATGGLVLRF